MAKVTISGEVLKTTKHTENFLNWCRGFFTDEAAERVLNAVLEAHRRQESDKKRKLNLDEFKSRKTVEDLCRSTELFRRTDGTRVFSVK